MEATFETEVVKIAGTPSNNLWSQNFAEIPTDPEKLSFRGQLFLVIYLNSQQKNLVEAGHKFWVNLSSQFYEKLEGGVLTALQAAAEQVLEKLLQETAFEEVGFVAASLWGKIFYLVQAGGASAALVRNGKFSKILPENDEKPPKTAAASGFLEDGDLVFLGTSQFFKNFSNLEKFSEKKSFEIEEELASIVGQAERGAQIAVQILKVKEAKVEEQAVAVTFAQIQKPKRLNFGAIMFKLFQSQLFQFWVKLLSRLFSPVKFFFKREIYLTTRSREFFRKNFFKLVFSILVLVLIVDRKSVV